MVDRIVGDGIELRDIHPVSVQTGLVNADIDDLADHAAVRLVVADTFDDIVPVKLFAEEVAASIRSRT